MFFNFNKTALRLGEMIVSLNTLKRVDCMVAEQYNFIHCEANPRFLRNVVISLGLLVVIEGNI